MKFKTIPVGMRLQGKRILLRVDWNVPLTGGILPEESLKIERSLETIESLTARGAIVIVLTHLGRPEKPDPHFSTKHLSTLLHHHYRIPVVFHGERVGKKEERTVLEAALKTASAGSVHLLENVRFEKGEETNDRTLAKAYASLADVFVNDAFASSHRKHVSVVGIADHLPGYAGPSLQAEVKALERLLEKPKKPFVCVIGGGKLSTKLPVLTTLYKICDRVCVGGAMATAFIAAKGLPVGMSLMEKGSAAMAKKLLAQKNIMIPIDVVVTSKLGSHPKLRSCEITDVASDEMIVDIGPKTLVAWGKELKSASTILWNGPIGLVEIEACGAGSRFIARAIARRATSKAYGVAGGGDTLPVIMKTHTQKKFDHVSTGGGALLEFLTNKGMLPGIKPFIKTVS